MINIFQPNVGSESLKLLEEVFASNWLGRGAQVTQFEQGLAAFLGTEPARIHTLSSCSDAIFAILKCLDIPRGKKVVIPSISFPCIPSAIIEAGLEPVVIDTEAGSGNISLDALAEHFGPDCVAVFVTDYGGIPNNIGRIREIVGADCRILVDGAASLGTFVDGEFSGHDADFVCWSFDAMKLLTCGEGGGVYIPDPVLMRVFKEYTYLGLAPSEKSGLDKSRGEGANWWEYQLLRPGSRSVFTNVNAAIGLPQIPQLPQLLEHRAEMRARYEAAFADVEGLGIYPQTANNVRYSNYFFTISTDQRDALARHLLDNGVYSSLRYYPIHLIDIFKAHAKPCANADRFSKAALNLPIHNALTDEDQATIIEQVQLFFDGSGQ